MTCFFRPIRYLAFLFFLIRFFKQHCVDAVTLSQPNSPLTKNALGMAAQKQRFQRLPLDPLLGPSNSSPYPTTEPSTPESSNEFGTQRKNRWHKKGIVPPRHSRPNATFSATGDSNGNITAGPHSPVNPYGGFGDNGKTTKQTKTFPPRMTSAPESENDGSTALPEHASEGQGQTRHGQPHLMPSPANRVSGQVLTPMRQEQPDTAFTRDRPPYPAPFRMPQERQGTPVTSVRGGVQQPVTPDFIPVIPVFRESFPADSNLLGTPVQTSRQPSVYVPSLMDQPVANRDDESNQKNDLSGLGLPRHLPRPPFKRSASESRRQSNSKRGKRSKRGADRAPKFSPTSTDLVPLPDVQQQPQQQMPFQAEQYVRTSPALWGKFNDGGPGQNILANSAPEKQQDFGKKFAETQQRYSDGNTPTEKKSKKNNKRKRDEKQELEDSQKKRAKAPQKDAPEPGMLRGNLELEKRPNSGMPLSNAVGGNIEQPLENALLLPGPNRFLASQGGVSVGGGSHLTNLLERENSRISNNRFPQAPFSASQAVSLLEISSLNSNLSTSSEKASLKESANNAAQPGASSMNNSVDAELGTVMPPPPRFEQLSKPADTSATEKPLVSNATHPLAPEATTPSTPEIAKPLALEDGTEPLAAQVNSKQPDQALKIPPMIRDKVQSKPTMKSQSKNATAPIKKNVKDIAVQLRKALTKKRKLSQEKAEAEEGRKEQEKNLEEHKKRLREKEAGAVEKMRTYETLLSEVEELAKVADTAFVKVANFSLPNESDVPRALPVEGGALGNFDCPIHCDPTICTEPPSDLTQCFQTVNKDQTATASSTEKQHLCAPFANPDTLDCSPGYVPCSQATPQENAEFKVPVSTLQKPEYANITIHGYNMHQCLRLILLPPTENCDAKNVASMMMATGPIMGYGGNAVYPTVTQDGHTAQFNQIQLLQEGTFQLCIVQFGKKPAKSPMEAAASFQNEGILVSHATIAGKIKGIKPGQTSSPTVKPSTSSSVAASNVTPKTLSKNNPPVVA